MSFDEAHCAVSPFPGRVPHPRASDAESQCGGLHRSWWRAQATQVIESVVADGSASSAGERGAVEFGAVQLVMTPKEIRSRRLALGMSVEDLARELALPPGDVREMESGERPVTNPRLLDQVFARGVNASRSVRRSTVAVDGHLSAAHDEMCLSHRDHHGVRGKRGPGRM